MTIFGGGRLELRQGDCLAFLDAMAPNSIDACVTDPPYHLLSTVKRFGAPNAAPINNRDEKEGRNGSFHRASRGFMGKEWDGGDIAFQAETWAKVLRVLKPGGYLVAFSAPKCQHRMVCAIEDAGFEIRDGLVWLFGTGFPKSHDVSKGIDALLGAERTKVRIDASRLKNPPNLVGGAVKGDDRPWRVRAVENGFHEVASDEAASDEAAQWAGFGTALKPAYEPICLARKPLEGTNAQNVLKWGVGALNIDGCRVETDESITATRNIALGSSRSGIFGAATVPGVYKQQPGGRWPANIVHDGSDEVVSGFPQANSSRANGNPNNPKRGANHTATSYGQGDDTHTHDFRDTGSAARYFYSAKASKHDRAGSKHPTVKPVNLMRWLCRLVTPPGGLILDPFAGSGTTGAAAHLEGFRAILCEREVEYQTDIVNRLRELCGEDPPWVKLQEIASAGAPPWAKL